MKRFKLRGKSQGRMHNIEFIVDDSDAHLVRGFAWSLRQKTSGGYEIRRKVNGVDLYLSHVLACPATGFHVRHVNNDSLDFRKTNLIAYKPVDGVCWRGHSYEGEVCHKCNNIAVSKYREKKVEATT